MSIPIDRTLVSSASAFLPGGLCFTKEQKVHVHPSQNLWVMWLWQPKGSLGKDIMSTGDLAGQPGLIEDQ